MLRIGLTGGIGSGKTTVAKIFEALSIPLYYADDAAKRLMNTDNALKQGIIDLLGREAYNANGLDRKKVSALLFNNPEKVKAMNALVHPVTIQDAVLWMQQQTAPYAIKEAALIFESGSEKELDYIITVTAPESVRIQRIRERDHLDEDAIRKRMQHQLPEAAKIEKSDFIVVNDGTQMLIPQVVEIHQTLLKHSLA
jgi:dephospho-CoA kinase